MEFSEMSKQPHIENAEHSISIENSVIHNIQRTKRQKKKRVLYKCKVCQKSFRFLSTCQAHTKVHAKSSSSNDVLRTFHCRLCNTNHRGLSLFLEHQSLHENLKQYPQELIYVSPAEHNEHLEIPTQDVVGHSADGGSPEEVIVTTSDTNIQISAEENHGHHGRDSNNVQSHENNSVFANVTQSIISNAIGLTVEQLSSISSIPIVSAASVMAVLCSATTQPTNTTTNQPAATTSVGSKTVASDGLQINIPSQVKTIYLNSNNPTSGDLSKQLDSLHRKVDIIMKHLSIPLDEDDNNFSMSSSIEDERQRNLADDSNSAIMLESFPPSYSVVQAAKEHQQQEYYALQASSRQSQQAFKSDNTQILTCGTTNRASKNIDLWLPASQHAYGFSNIAALTEQTNQSEKLIEVESAIIATQIIDKIFVESRSRANFAKNLTFAIFTPEERRGRNCTGRVFGKARHKGQLDNMKLNAVKEATFRKYPCRPDLVDITWRKECITAIDSGLRNEHRSGAKHQISNNAPLLHHRHQNIDTSVGGNDIMSKIE